MTILVNHQASNLLVPDGRMTKSSVMEPVAPVDSRIMKSDVAANAVHIRRLLIASGHEVINVDAADTTSHTITLGEGSYSPDGYTVTSEPAGIDDLTFVPADLDPGVAYHVRIFNGWCGYADVTVNNLTLVSETEAEWPADRTRTDIGVGEVVKLSVSPDMANVSWSCDSNISHLTSTGTVTLVAGEIQESVSVTASLPGLSLAKTFSVLTPTDFCYSCPWYEEPYPMGAAGAAAILNIKIAPTNVSFSNILITEGYSDALFTDGWYLSNPTYALPHDVQLGASPVDVNSFNEFSDVISSGLLPAPWSEGSMMWHIPIRWFVPSSSGVTNFHEFATLAQTQSFSIDGNGTVEVSKFGSTVRRQTNSRTVKTDSNGRIVP